MWLVSAYNAMRKQIHDIQCTQIFRALTACMKCMQTISLAAAAKGAQLMSVACSRDTSCRVYFRSNPCTEQTRS